jgi:Zn-dependent protease
MFLRRILTLPVVKGLEVHSKFVVDAICCVVGMFVAAPVHEFGHYSIAMLFGGSPSLLIGESVFGFAFLTDTGLDLGSGFWASVAAGPLVSGTLMLVLSYWLWGFRVAALFQFLYTQLELCTIYILMGVVDSSIGIPVLIVFLMELAVGIFFLIMMKWSNELVLCV